MTVHLVGAGPGDPGLLTCRAVELLKSADVVVYDRPSMADIVAIADSAEILHCVGKAGSRAAWPQKDVNELLVQLGRDGREVVRLKAGDAFVVSRGGEEAIALAAAGVPFDIVPGISAAIAAPALAGIPVMVRQVATTLTVIAGNDDPEYRQRIDWDAVARVGGTIVVLTGRSALRDIAARLMAGGLAADTPVAAISAASRPHQRTELGTLAELPNARLRPPVTFVVGEVAALDLLAVERPAGPKPAEPKPDGQTPAEAEPVGAELAGADPAGTERAEAEVARADPAEAEPAGAEPAGADLAGTEPAEAELARAELAGADLVGADLATAGLAGENAATDSRPEEGSDAHS
ncbi:uroporphyrinogen-III C-methyltransferase [Kutzneria chonburiensis]|uniref:uroporphyrinogen-III C-methyltransferase n=1 Tax=Kutzneria chonburiensis TaxID=1483604 RepID=A0ABV6N6Q1_9PSEU|nr:uroporphyrinogen-III C-methyltransferase [Kutzneria chonburiensis]